MVRGLEPMVCVKRLREQVLLSLEKEGVLREFLILFSLRNFKLNRFFHVVCFPAMQDTSLSRETRKETTESKPGAYRWDLLQENSINSGKQVTVIEVVSHCKAFMLAKVSYC